MHPVGTMKVQQHQQWQTHDLSDSTGANFALGVFPSIEKWRENLEK